MVCRCGSGQYSRDPSKHRTECPLSKSPALSKKLYALALVYTATDGVNVRAGYCTALSEDEAIGKGVRYMEEKFAQFSDHKVTAKEIPLNVVKHVAEAST